MTGDSKDPMTLLLELLSAIDENDGSDPLAVETSMILDIRALRAGAVPYGDDGLAEVAKRVLRAGAQGIADGAPSPSFLLFIADAIARTIDDKEPSLDRALHLTPKAGRKPSPPQKNDPIVYEFTTAMTRVVEGGARPGYGQPGFDELERRALDEAFRKAYGSCPSQQRAQGINEKSITDRMTKVKRTLTERGVYMPHKSKGKKRSPGL